MRLPTVSPEDMAASRDSDAHASLDGDEITIPGSNLLRLMREMLPTPAGMPTSVVPAVTCAVQQGT